MWGLKISKPGIRDAVEVVVSKVADVTGGKTGTLLKIGLAGGSMVLAGPAIAGATGVYALMGLALGLATAPAAFLVGNLHLSGNISDEQYKQADDVLGALGSLPGLAMWGLGHAANNEDQSKLLTEFGNFVSAFGEVAGAEKEQLGGLVMPDLLLEHERARRRIEDDHRAYRRAAADAEEALRKMRITHPTAPPKSPGEYRHDENSPSRGPRPREPKQPGEHDHRPDIIRPGGGDLHVNDSQRHPGKGR